MISKKVLLNRIFVGIGIGAVMVGMVLLAAFDNPHTWMRALDSAIIYVLILLAVVEMRRALGRERIPDSFSWIIWTYGFILGPAYTLFGYTGIIFFSLLVFAASAVTALYINRADSLMYIAFMLVYPGMFMASMLYINKCASTQIISENSPVYPYLIRDVWAYLGNKRVASLLPYNAIGLAFVFAVSSFTDTFAFIFGISFGKHPLCPEISPKKTVEGAIGGVFGGLFGSFLVYMLFDFFQVFGPSRGLAIHGLSDVNLILAYVLIGIFGSVMTQIGDLLASLVKRHCGVKDYSRVLGEHGGIMDRFDGIILNATFVAVVYMFII